MLGSIQSTRSGVWEEYRYDGLGRRVAVRTLRPNELCSDTSTCYNSTTNFVWAGDQLLWEIREANAPNIEHASGMVSYFQAGGIDRPLTIWKDGIGTVVTHQNWRGQFARGTFGVGARAGQSSDCTEYPATNGCIPVRWPGWNTTAWSQEAAKPATTGSEEFWFGSLSVGMRDASGQQYMRNRYYNPQTGQFTQPDPIGLAGGLNSYGFAAGDPVSYADPYGLCPEEGSSIECPIVLPEVTVVASPRLVLRPRGDGTDILIGGGIAGRAVGPGRALLARLGGGLRQLLGRRVATQTGRFSGMLRSAARGKGNLGIGRATAAEADELGRAWVGEGFRTASDGTTLISRDGLRQYRPPSYKPRLGREQANLEARQVAEGQWQSNAHIDIVP